MRAIIELVPARRDLVLAAAEAAEPPLHELEERGRIEGSPLLRRQLRFRLCVGEGEPLQRLALARPVRGK
jgi:hypothetical protein